jgi:hypothetical protein
MNVKCSSTKPTPRVNLLPSGCKLIFVSYVGDSAEDKNGVNVHMKMTQEEGVLSRFRAIKCCDFL